MIKQRVTSCCKQIEQLLVVHKTFGSETVDVPLMKVEAVSVTNINNKQIENCTKNYEI